MVTTSSGFSDLWPSFGRRWGCLDHEDESPDEWGVYGRRRKSSSSPVKTISIYCLVVVFLTGMFEGGGVSANECTRLCSPLWMWEASLAEVQAELDAKPGAATQSNKNYITPLHVAAAANPDSRVAGLLVGRGASLEARDAHGATPLHYAAGGVGKGNAYLIMNLIEKYLRKHGLRRVWEEKQKVEQRLKVTGNVPSVVEFLLVIGADVTARDKMEQTPLHHAAFNTRHLRVIELLLQYGAEVDATDRLGYSPLHHAVVGNNNSKVVELLLNSGANLELRSRNGTGTPLHSAAVGIIPDSLKLLLEWGGDIEARDEKGRTPLHMAAMNMTPEMAEVLIDYGADLESRDGQGRTPLQSALSGANPAVPLLFIRKGANTQIRDDERRTTYDLLKSNSRRFRQWSPRQYERLESSLK